MAINVCMRQRWGGRGLKQRTREEEGEKQRDLRTETVRDGATEQDREEGRERESMHCNADTFMCQHKCPVSNYVCVNNVDQRATTQKRLSGNKN